MTVIRLDRKMAAAGDEQPQEEEKRVTFSDFYAAYPRKRSRLVALKAWANVSIEDRRKILPALAAQKLSDDWRRDGGKYIPYPASWLRGGCWDDEVDTDLSMGQCSWNMHGNRGPDPRCDQPATVEKRNTPYCKRHGDQVS